MLTSSQVYLTREVIEHKSETLVMCYFFSLIFQVLLFSIIYYPKVVVWKGQKIRVSSDCSTALRRHPFPSTNNNQ